MTGYATKIAELALVQAKRADAMDDALYPCKLCGSPARRIFSGADESMHRGYAIVKCTSGDQEIEVKPTRGDCGYAEEDEAFRRWQILNKP